MPKSSAKPNTPLVGEMSLYLFGFLARSYDVPNFEKCCKIKQKLDMMTMKYLQNLPI